ncbi:uncharacterized protein LOC126846780 isoform X2 [Adelges cooleyi]|uniref:uncharacterized protein LOC126846780 isoform X2 n=1 Tax=Adelges cooleyi TaxID=133065 RepID=UPI00217F4CA0|nr:uncharacterized protein LOC126846780 isoform X2 [Adelges cooleyi]
MYDELIITISYCQKMHLQMREFCSIVRFSALLHVGCYTGSLITIAYNVGLLFVTYPVNCIGLLQFFASYICIAVQLLNFLYFLDIMNEARDGLNFGLYSCNWTAMDMRFRKLLLLAMAMNNANQLNIRATPTKIIDLKLFLNVLQTSYSIANIMMKLSNTDDN